MGLFPVLRFFPPFRGAFKIAASGLEKCRDFLRESIQKHQDTLDVNNPRDLIDKFLIARPENPALTKEKMNNFSVSSVLFRCDNISRLEPFEGGREGVIIKLQ